MSWLNKIQTQLIIKTGDGKEYRPQWLNASKTVEYNTSKFEFPNISGTLVYRGTPKGSKYNLEIYFQGENHLDTSLAFETSASDPRAWTVTHPFYGLITVQPTALNFDNTGYNVSKITGTIIETITDEFPKGTVAPQDKIAADVESTNAALAESYGNNATPTARDITDLTASNLTVYTDGAKYVDTDIAEEYINAFNDANAALLTATDEPLAAMQAQQEVLAMPARFNSNLATRFTILSNQFDYLRSVLPSTRNQKIYYQNAAGTTIAALALAVSTPSTGDYGNRNMVLSTIENFTSIYNQYLEDLDTLQSENGGNPDSFIPDINALILLNDLVNFTISNLFAIATDSKQERSIVLEYDSNWVLLAHRFYGLQVDDSTITELINNNGAGLSEMLHIKKNRKIIYYV